MRIFRPTLKKRRYPKDSKNARKEVRQFIKYSGRLVKSSYQTPTVHY